MVVALIMTIGKWWNGDFSTNLFLRGNLGNMTENLGERRSSRNQPPPGHIWPQPPMLLPNQTNNITLLILSPIYDLLIPLFPSSSS